jgi:hypothetical protein
MSRRGAFVNRVRPRRPSPTLRIRARKGRPVRAGDHTPSGSEYIRPNVPSTWIVVRRFHVRKDLDRELVASRPSHWRCSMSRDPPCEYDSDVVELPRKQHGHVLVVVDLPRKPSRSSWTFHASEQTSVTDHALPLSREPPCGFVCCVTKSRSWRRARFRLVRR